MRKVLLVFGLLVFLLGTIGTVSATTITTNINFVGSGHINEVLSVRDASGNLIASEGTNTFGINMNYALSSVKNFSSASSTKTLSVTADELYFNSEMYMGDVFDSYAGVYANNASLSYITTSDHINNNYTRNITMSANYVQYITTSEKYTSAGLYHFFNAQGNMYSVNFSSEFAIDTSTINNSTVQNIADDIIYNVPSVNITTNTPSFDGTLSEYTTVPISANISPSINVQSYSVNNTINVDRTISNSENTVTQNIYLNGLFNNLNSSTNFFTDTINLAIKPY